jgi:signal transduction histidine kinase
MSSSRLTDPARLQYLRDTGLLNRPSTDTLERFARIASLAVGAPMTLVNLIDDRRQVTVAGSVLPEPWAPSKQLPHSHSICRLVVESASPLVVANATDDQRLANHPAVRELGVRAYAGMPLQSEVGPLGAFCAVSSEPRDWSNADLELLEELAAAASDFIALRHVARIALNRNEGTLDSARAVAHDLRNPLHAVRLSLSAIADPAVRDASFDAIVKTATEQIDVASDMLDRFGAVQDALDAGPKRMRVDLHALLASEVDAIRPHSEDIEWELDLRGPEWVTADRTGMHRVFANLLNNAGRFATERTRVQARSADGVLEVVVEDDGPGLPGPSAFKHVWDAGSMFHRGRGSQTGVGLAVVRAIVEQHGGSVEAGEASLGGARFVVRIPLG